MNVNDTTPEEKSVILAELVPFLEVIRTDLRYDEPYIISVDGRWSGMDIYTEWNEWAFLVLNWAMNNTDLFPKLYDWLFGDDSDEDGYAMHLFAVYSPAEAQAAWLDKILEMAIAAGMVE